MGVARVIRVIILNGGSSSGKTTIATCLQDILPSPWLRLGVDTLLEALPKALLTSDTGIEFGVDGSVLPGQVFRRLESAWMQSIAAMAHAGARIIIEDVFISGIDARNRWQTALTNISALWVGVQGDPAVATERERGRGDRITGMATLQRPGQKAPAFTRGMNGLLSFPGHEGLLPARLGARPGASWRGVRPRAAPGFSRGRCHDLEVDTSETSAVECAQRIAQLVDD
jgi:chloramphenicol 3-O phosphotransferase